MTAHDEAATAVSRQIMLKFQGHDLARETDDGMIHMSGHQIELLERLCNEAAGAAITAYLATMQEQGWVMVPREATDNMVDAARHFLEPQTERIGRSCYRAMIEAAKGE
jgi:hypothetical protein